MRTDVLIVGSGVAGLSAAIKLAELRPDLHILLMGKNDPGSTNSARAQGGIASVMHEASDKPMCHLEDTLAAGQNLNNAEAVKLLVNEVPDRIRELEAWGAQFDKNRDGTFQSALEGGHRFPRIVCSRDATGKEVMRVLLDKVSTLPNVHPVFNLTATGLIFTEDRCTGIKALQLGSADSILISANAVILATGGCGQVYRYTTNPSGATGDGIALAGRAGAGISGMQYIQFHPTALYQPDKPTLYLLSEALRGLGARIVDEYGRRFLFSYDKRGELATRDVVSSAIIDTMKKTAKPCVYLSLRHLPANLVRYHFPTITTRLEAEGFDFTRDRIPIVPAAHYQCGGITTDLMGRTNISKLYAVGECANNGVQGANRLASNSLAEALVFPHITAVHMASWLPPSVVQQAAIVSVVTWLRSGDIVQQRAIHKTHNHNNRVHETSTPASSAFYTRYSVGNAGEHRMNQPSLFENEGSNAEIRSVRMLIKTVMTQFAGPDASRSDLLEARLELDSVWRLCNRISSQNPESNALSNLHYIAQWIVLQKLEQWR